MPLSMKLCLDPLSKEYQRVLQEIFLRVIVEMGKQDPAFKFFRIHGRYQRLLST